MKKTKKQTLKEIRNFIEGYRNADDELFQKAILGLAYILNSTEIIESNRRK